MASKQSKKKSEEKNKAARQRPGSVLACQSNAHPGVYSFQFIKKAMSNG